MKNVFLYLGVLCFITHITACAPASSPNSEDVAALSLYKLNTDYTDAPLGIDVQRPRFSWAMAISEEQRNIKQIAYQVVVTDEWGETVWDSTKVNSDVSVHVQYAGSPLKPRTRYDWTLTVWDNQQRQVSKSAWFETGLLNPDISAWNGAQWIGADDKAITFHPDYLPLYDLSVGITIPVNSHEAGLVFAANDPRLLSPHLNVYQLANKYNESYFKVVLDVGGLSKKPATPATLNVYRAGYTPNDNPAVPVSTFTIKQDVINAGNAHARHALLIHNEYGTLTLQVNNRSDFFVGAENVPFSPFDMLFPPLVKGAKVTLNPLGHNHDNLTYGMLNGIGFYVPKGQTAVFDALEVRNIHAPNNIVFADDVSGEQNSIFANTPEISIKEARYVVTAQEQDTLITAHPPANGAPVLRTAFDVSQKAIKKARLYVTARGIYDFYINGKRVSDDYYNPGLTQYNKTHLYQTYDVTDALVSGSNAMGAVLGEGWWSGLLSFGNTWNAFGDRQSLLAQLVVTYKDGSEQVLTTNENDWQYTQQGPVRYGSLQMGEVYDARLESAFETWHTTEFDASAWQNAIAVPLDGSATKNVRPNMARDSQSLDYSQMQLVGQIGETANIFTTLTAQSVKEVKPGVFIYDMGQNMVGVPSLQFADGKAGQTVTLRVGEMLYPDLPESGPNVGMLMTENYRAALSQDIYVMKDGAQSYSPRFTSHGYQYLEISGLDTPLPLDSVKGLVTSSVQGLTASYSCSNDNVNQLWSNLVWSNVDNFLWVPTDCPQRNERMGWSGDINVFGRTATFVSNASPFLRRHLQAMRDTQSPEGRYADIAPVGGGFGGILWGSAGITLPWESYLQYGDVAMLEEHYDSMQRYMSYLEGTINPVTGLIMDAGLGDWLGPQNNQLGSAYLASAYYVFTLDIMADVANVLGHSDDSAFYAKTANQRRAHFASTFLNDEQKTLGKISNASMFDAMAGELKTVVADTQTSYAVGLAMGAFQDDEKDTMAANLARTVAQSNVDDTGTERPPYSLMTGFIGTAWISQSLSEHGYSEEAYKLLLNDQYPSWLYPVKQGATTIWERLNGYTVENGFGGNNNMNSFNHYSFGAVGQWLMQNSGGIQRGEPGFKSFKLAPEIDPTGSITWVDASYESLYGTIVSQWKQEDGTLEYKATVPANTEATLILPATSVSNITENGVALENVSGLRIVEATGQQVIMTLGSGQYNFAIKR
ncbi:family 78 glycoside hydrolase catalytic domain [Alteromonas sp. AMM-1]|uniref:family 78 glycoside hydrolase catalytic domain n=1 Tax=Alteromonas sp. AMM-1 TaxID=3394233 RepID=UPI0039A73500